MEYLYILLLVIASGIFSGLNLGFFSLATDELERKARLGDAAAIRILPLRSRGNWLLTTLLLGNVLVNTILSVFLGSVTTGLFAVIIATSLIVVFGEIAPQAAFARFALKLIPPLIPFIRLSMVLLSPIAWPIAQLLDYLLGRELTPKWSKDELRDIVENQSEEDEQHTSPNSIDEDERRVVLGALKYAEMKVREVMTPKDVVYQLEASRVIDDALFEEMHTKGFTRIPVFRRREGNIIGILNVKDTLLHDAGVTVENICKRNKFIKVNANAPLGRLLNQFVKRKIHLACVYEADETFVGIVTLEDVVEEILDLDIVDEQDRHVDMRSISKAEH